MLSRIILAAAVAVAFLIPALASADDDTPADKGNGLSWCDQQYIDLYQQAADLGHPLGRNAVKDGLDSEKRICQQVDELHAVIVDLTYVPPEPEPVEAASDSSSTASGGYSIPEEIVMCESGGDYSAVNPSSGAYGAYQIMPSTSEAYGCDMSTPAGQDACAAEIYADSGGSAWVC